MRWMVLAEGMRLVAAWALSGLAAAVPLMRGFDPCQRAAGNLHAAGRSPGRRSHEA